MPFRRRMERLPRVSVGQISYIDWKVSELRVDFSARTPYSAKCGDGGGLDTPVNSCPVLLDVRNIVIYSSIGFKDGY